MYFDQERLDSPLRKSILLEIHEIHTVYDSAGKESGFRDENAHFIAMLFSNFFLF